jgi:hypothetical protein
LEGPSIEPRGEATNRIKKVLLLREVKSFSKETRFVSVSARQYCDKRIRDTNVENE